MIGVSTSIPLDLQAFTRSMMSLAALNICLEDSDHHSVGIGGCEGYAESSRGPDGEEQRRGTKAMNSR